MIEGLDITFYRLDGRWKGNEYLHMDVYYYR